MLGRVRSRGGKHGRFRDERGVAMTEFVLVLPALVIVIVALIAFGLIFFFWLDANKLASETARWAAVDQKPTAITTSFQQYIKDSVPGGMQDGLDVCIDLYGKTPDTVAVGDPVRVRVERGFSPFPFLWSDIVVVRASSTMRIERFNNPNGQGPPTSYKPGPPNGGEDIGTCGD